MLHNSYIYSWRIVPNTVQYYYEKSYILKTLDGKYPYWKWHDKLDNSISVKIDTRIDRLEEGNYGDFKRIDNELSELRFKIGKGYRVYFTEFDDYIVIILAGGDKSTQQKDIIKANEYIKDIQERYKNG